VCVRAFSVVCVCVHAFMHNGGGLSLLERVLKLITHLLFPQSLPNCPSSFAGQTIFVY